MAPFEPYLFMFEIFAVILDSQLQPSRVGFGTAVTRPTEVHLGRCLLVPSKTSRLQNSTE